MKDFLGTIFRIGPWKRRATLGRSADLGVVVENQYCTANSRNVVERRRRITLEVELEDALQVGKRLFGENDHAILRGLGRAAALPRARAAR